MRRLALLNWAGHLLLGVGLCAPCMTITPRMEPHTGLARWLGLVKEPETYAIVKGIARLLEAGNLLLGIVLLTFSCLFPVVKLILLRGAIGAAGHAAVHRFGKYSMVDVFVIALLVVASKSFPGGTTVEVRWGVFVFAAAALLPMAVGQRLYSSTAARAAARRAMGTRKGEQET